MNKNVKSALMVAVFLSALYCPAKAAEHIVVQPGTAVETTYDNYNGYNSSGHGGVYENYGTLNILDSVTLTQNSAAGNGGAIYNAVGAQTNVGNNVTFTNNTANASYYGGGALYNEGNVIIGTNAKFNNNYVTGVVDAATKSGTVGSAVANWNGGQITIGNGAEFKNNGYTDSTNSTIGASDGGAIYNSGKTGVDGYLRIGDNATFDGNVAQHRAGALYNGESHVEIGNNAVFTNNSAERYGAIYNYYSADGRPKSDIVIGDNANISSNTAREGNGGAVGNFYDDFTVGNNAVFNNNKAENGLGGAIISSGNASVRNATVTIGERSAFTANKAVSGGAIYNDGNASIVNINGGNTNGATTFSENTASNKGGAVYTDGIVNLKADKGAIVFSNNTAVIGGSDMYLADGSKVNISGTNNVTFASSGQSIAGSGNIEKTGTGTLNLQNGDFKTGYTGTYTQNSGKLAVNNATMFKKSDIKGGSIELQDGAKVDGANVKLADNTGIDIANGTVEFSNGTTLVAASANSYVNNNLGGTMKLTGVDFSGFNGIYNQSNGSFVLNNAKMFGNTNITGGQIDMSQSSVLKIAQLATDTLDIASNSSLTVTGDTTVSGSLTANGSSVTAGSLAVTGDTTLNNSNLHVTTGLAKFKNYSANKPPLSNASVMSLPAPVTTSNGTFDAGYEADNIDITDHNMQVTGTTTVHQNAKLSNSVLHSTDKFTVGNALTASNSEVTVDANGIEVTGITNLTSSTVVAGGGLKLGSALTAIGSEITSNGNMQSASDSLVALNNRSKMVVNGNYSGGNLSVADSTANITGTGSVQNLTVSGETAGVAFGDSATVANALNVSSGTLSVNNAKDLTVTGNTQIGPNGRVTVGGLASLNNGLTIGGASSKIEAGSIAISGANADGNALTTTGGRVDATSGTLTVNGKTDVSDTFMISKGNMSLNDTLTASNSTISTTSGDIIVQKGANFTNTTVNSRGNVEFKDNVIANGSSGKRTKIQSGTNKDVSALNMNLTNSDVVSGKDINITTTTGTTEFTNSTMTANNNLNFAHALNAKANSIFKTLTGNINVADKTILNKSTVNSAGSAAFNGGLETSNGSTVIVGNGMTVGNAGTGDLKLNNSNVTVNAGGLTVEGNTSVASYTTVDVTGDMNLKNGATLSSISSELKSSGNMVISGTNTDGNSLTVTGGNITSGGNLTVADNASLANARVISTGNTSIGGNLTSDSSYVTANNLEVKGATVLANTKVTTTGSANFEGGLSASATQNGKNITVGNGMTVGKNGTGDMSLTGIGLTVSSGGLNVAGLSEISDAIVQVTGTGTFGKGLTLENNSSLTTSDKLTVTSGGLNVNDSSLTVTGGGMDVTGNAVIQNGSDVTITGDALFNNKLTVDGSSITTTAGSDISVIGETILNNATSDFGGAIDFQGGLTTTGSSNITLHTDLVADSLDFGAGTITKVDGGKATITHDSDLNNTSLTITNKADDKNNTFGGDLNLHNGSKLEVTDGNVAVGGNVNMTTDNNSKNQLIVNGNTSVTGNINAGDDAQKKIDVSGQLSAGKVTVKNGDLDAGSMQVTGNTVLTDTIANVTGDGTFTGGFVAQGSAANKSQTSVGGSFISGNTTLNNSTLIIDKTSTVNGTLNLVDSSMTVGPVIKASTPSTDGDAAFNDKVSLNNSDLNIHGNAEFNKVDAAGQSVAPVSITNGSNLSVDKNADFKGSVSSADSNINVGGNMTVAGGAEMTDSNLTVGGDLSVDKTTVLSNVIAEITGSATFKDGLNVNQSQTVGGDKTSFNVGNGITVGDAASTSALNLTNTALTVNAGGLKTFGDANLKNTIADITGNANIGGDLSITDKSTMIATGDITVGNASGNGLVINNGAIQSTNGNLTVTNKTNLTDAVVDIKGNASFGDGLTLNEGTKQTVLQTGGNLTSTTITSTNGSIAVGGDLTATGDTVLDKTAVKVTGDANFANLETNSSSVPGESAYQIEVGGAVNAAIVDLTNTVLDVGNGLTVTENAFITNSEANIAGDSTFNKRLDLLFSNITSTAGTDAANPQNGNLTVDGLANIVKSSIDVAGDASFNGGMLINTGSPSASYKSTIKAGGSITSSTIDAMYTDFIAGNGLILSDYASLNDSNIDATGNSSIAGYFNTTNTNIVTHANTNNSTAGDFTVTGLSTLDSSQTDIAGDANFNGGLVANKYMVAQQDKYQIKAGGKINASDVDVTNVHLVAGNGMHTTGNTLLSSSAATITGDTNIDGSLTVENSLIKTNKKDTTPGGEGNFTAIGAAVINNSVVDVAGTADFQDGVTINNTGDKHLVKTGKDFNTTNALITNAVLNVGGNYSSSGTTDALNTAIVTNGNFNSIGNVTLTDSSLLTKGNLETGANLLLTGTNDKSNVIVNGNSIIGQDLNLTNSSFTVKGDSNVDGVTNAVNNSAINVVGNGIFNGKLTVDDNSSIEIGKGITFNDGFNLTNNSNAYIHGDPTLDGDIRVTNGSVMNFVNPVKGFNTATGGSLYMSNGTINEMNSVITHNTFNGDFIVADGKNANFTVDIDPRAWKTDSFTFNSIRSETPGADANIVISDFNFSSYPLDRHIHLPQMFYSNTEIPDNINFLSNDKLIFSPIGWYGLYGSPGTGYTASLTKYNPQVFRGQVATRAAHANQWIIDDILLNHALLQGNRLLNEKDANKYSAILPEFAPYQYDKKHGGLWFKSYGNFETLSMTQDLNVKNNAYGGLVGADFPVENLGHGWTFMPTAYVAYNGSHQTFDYVGMYQNGGQAGAMGTFVKGHFIGSVLANGGIYSNSMDVAGYTDETFNWFAGTAAKAAYNFDVTRNFTIQPTLMAMYNTFGEQNWYTQFGDMGMYSGFLYGLNVAPGLNLIYGKKDWSVYATFQYVFNPLDNMQGHVGRSVDLPRIGLRHTFFEYGVGFTKMWKDRLNSYGQVTMRNGGRTGISFQFGLNWLF